MGKQRSASSVVQVDLTKPGLVQALPVACNDPDATRPSVSATVSRPANSTVTKGPHSLTFEVRKNDETVLNLGEACPLIKDTGITGSTRSHVHWEVKESPLTLVSLGKGPGSTFAQGSSGGTAVKDTTGYLMITQGHAWQEAEQQVCLLSHSDDVILRTEADRVATLQSDHGTAEVLGGKNAMLGAAAKAAVVADSGFVTSHVPYGQKKNPYQAPDYICAKVAKSALAAGDVAFSAVSLVGSFLKTSAAPVMGTPDWAEMTNADVAKTFVDVGKLASTSLRTADSWSKSSGASAAALCSSGYTSVSGDVAASIYGHLSASVSSLLSASVLGGTASVKGFGWTSIWSGRETSVKSLMNAKLEGERGKASVKGKKSVEILSKSGDAVVQCGRVAQFASTGGPAYLFGSKRVYVGCEEGGGKGLCLTGTGAYLGAVSQPGAFGRAKVEPDKGAVVIDTKAGEVRLQHGQAKIRLKDGEIFFDSSKAWNCTVGGMQIKHTDTKVLLG